MNVAGIIDHLGTVAVKDRPHDLMAVAHPGELGATRANKRIRPATPEDVVYMSVTPFIYQTQDGAVAKLGQ